MPQVRRSCIAVSYIPPPLAGAFSPSNSGVADSPTDKASETAGRPDGVKTEPRAIVFHPRKNEQVDMRDLMIYQQVRRIDELERRISELQLELKQCEGQQGRTDRSSRATQTNQPSQSVQTNLTIRAGPLTSPNHLTGLYLLTKCAVHMWACHSLLNVRLHFYNHRNTVPVTFSNHKNAVLATFSNLKMGSFIHFSNLCMWRFSISRETKVAPLFEGSHGIQLLLMPGESA